MIFHKNVFKDKMFLENKNGLKVQECFEYKNFLSTRMFWVQECFEYKNVLSARMFSVQEFFWVQECFEYKNVH